MTMDSDLNGDPEFMAEVRRSVQEQLDIGCTCSQDLGIQSQHPKDCRLWENDDWKEGRAEWDPVSDQLLYYFTASDKAYYLTDFDKVWLPADAVDMTSADDDEVVEGVELACKCEPEKQWFCAVCKVQRENSKAPWVYWSGTHSNTGTKWVAKCRHYMQPILLPNGVTIYASSHHHFRDKDELHPDFGVYLDTIWSPDCLAYSIPWNDHGLPTISLDDVGHVAISLMEYAKAGKKIEIGCIGGHGRTGTLIAMLAILGGVRGKNAVRWVHKNYCEEAIESDQQEWLPLWFEGWLKNDLSKVPKKPVGFSYGGYYDWDNYAWIPDDSNTTTSGTGTTTDNTTKLTPPGVQTVAHPCISCKEPMAMELTDKNTRRFRCIRKNCTLGMVNRDKEGLDKPKSEVTEIVRRTIRDTIKERLHKGDWLNAGILETYLLDAHKPWPGEYKVRAEFKKTDTPLTLNEAIFRAMRKQIEHNAADEVTEVLNKLGDERLAEVMAE